MKSIIQSERECYFCGSPYVEDHHIFGGPNRKLSERYGLKVWLCREHHAEVHTGGDKMRLLREEGESAFLRAHGADTGDFIALFGRNYL